MPDRKQVKPGLDEIEQRLMERFPGARIGLQDDSHLHAGHTGSAGGAGHFTVEIAAAEFTGLGRVARHRLVYDAFHGQDVPSRIRRTPAGPGPAVRWVPSC